MGIAPQFERACGALESVMTSNIRPAVEIVDVAPRDGFQAVVPPIETGVKVDVVKALVAAGIKRVETGAFVSPKAVPQMADSAQVHAALDVAPGIRLPALIANPRGAASALEAGVSDLVYVFSISESHNNSNVRRTVAQSVDGLAEVIAVCRDEPGFQLRVNVATSFDCPFEGRIDSSAVLPWLEAVVAMDVPVEFGICDTTGRALPNQVKELFEVGMAACGDSAQVGWAFHGHDTFGLGVANALAAYEAGVRVFDAAAAGLGGCPFAPGATGNTATEDLVFTLENMGISTGVDMGMLLEAADAIAQLNGAQVGGHIRMVPRERAFA
jgi:hydroxymethylglutaryl-CoA lyase